MKTQKNENINISFGKECPTIKQMKAFVASELSSQEVSDLEYKLNHCKKETCQCEEYIEGLQLSKIAERIAQKEPHLQEGFNHEKLFQEIKAYIPKHLLQDETTLIVSKTIFSKKKVIPNRFLLSLAASFALIFLIWWMIPKQTIEQKLTQDSLKVNNNRIPIAEEKKVDKENKSIDTLKNTPEIKVEPKKEDSPKNLIVENSLAFEPNEGLENLINHPIVRGGNAGTIQFLDIRPQNNEVFKEKVILSWKSKINTTLYIDLLNNQGEIIDNKVLEPNIQEWVIDTKEFKNGLYYWKLMDEDAVLHTGKFLIKQ